MGLRFKLTLILIFMSGFISNAEGAWQGPTEMISGTWGPNKEQFGIEYDYFDNFGGPFYILLDGNIILTDIVNGRMKIYGNNGALLKVTKCKKGPKGEWNDECRIEGEYIQTTSDGIIWVDLRKHKKPRYSLYSPTGELLKTTTTRPLELGWVKSRKLGLNSYEITVTYPDGVYSLSSDRRFMRHVRDINGYVYGTNRGGVWKFDKCGRMIGAALMPDDQIKEHYPPGGGEPWVTVHAEYGRPVVAPNGDVYTWKRTDSTYSIIKWTWQDDSKTPKESDCIDTAKKDKKVK